jgi:nitroreductase
MSILETIQKRRSCRIFTSQPVEKEKQEALIKAALWSPTSKNSRPWEFILVDEPAIIEQLSNCKPHGAEFMKGATLAIVIAADPQKSDVWVEDTSIAASFIQLAAEDLGLGSCWVQVRLRQSQGEQSASEYCKQLLNIPEHFEVASIIAIGYKAKERQPYTDSALLNDRIHYNSFDI